jgi:hypothetical protein
MATWEHIVNDARIVNRENIARCCSACNSSKGIKKLSDWLESAYCGRRGITRDTIAEVVNELLRLSRTFLTKARRLPPMPSVTIKLFLVHGEPKRLRTTELSNWTGKAIAGPRS